MWLVLKTDADTIRNFTVILNLALRTQIKCLMLNQSQPDVGPSSESYSKH